LTIQITIIRIEGYGPWTLTLGSDREAKLQMLQSRIYYDVQRLFSERECLVYSNRFDEYIAISNGLSVSDHIAVHNQLAGLYPDFKLSMTIGKGDTPFEANVNAHKSRRSKEALTPAASILGLNLTPYEVTRLMVKVYSLLSDEFLKKSCMTFYVGGDNFMVISNDMTKEDAETIIGRVEESVGIKLNCGIGVGKTGRKAAKNATKALDTIRDLREKGKMESVYKIQ